MENITNDACLLKQSLKGTPTFISGADCRLKPFGFTSLSFSHQLLVLFYLPRFYFKEKQSMQRENLLIKLQLLLQGHFVRLLYRPSNETPDFIWEASKQIQFSIIERSAIFCTILRQQQQEREQMQINLTRAGNQRKQLQLNNAKGKITATTTEGATAKNSQ